MMSDDEAASTQADATASQRRRSGRAVRAPEKFVPEPASSQVGRAGKRKRTKDTDDEEVEDGAEDEEMAEDEEEEDAESESEPEEAPAKKKVKTKAAPKKAAAAKKTNGTSNATRAPKERAMTLPSRPRKPAQGRVVFKDKDAEGLYADIFTSGQTTDDVATKWLSQYDVDNTSAMTDLINCVLKSAGCDIKVTEDDINDPDNVPSRLEDIQEAHKDHTTADYPLVAKAKAANAHVFKSTLTGFFTSLFTIMRETGLLYEDIALIENITIWITTMSSSSLRPFRHTATVIALAITTALCEAVKAEVEVTAGATKMLEKEKGLKKPNDGRIAAFQKKVDDGKQHRETLQSTISELFDAVFVHRYRDLDSRIRSDCVEALGEWVVLLPSIFYDGSYLRYLGWELSDPVGHVRHEVLVQIKKITKRGEVGGITTFIERFRPRIIEMATLDAETSCRAAALELLDVIREKGMLEPDDIDVIGRLIFDSDPRVRKSVVPFFGAIIDDLYESKIEEVGGEEGLEDVFTLDDENKINPSAGWIKLKSLGESLYSYGNEGAESGEDSQDPKKLQEVNTAEFKSRYCLAAEVLYDKIEELQDWEMLTGYLLYDHSNAQDKGSLTVAIQNAFKLEENEEVVLLDILHTSIEVTFERLGDDKHSKKRSRAGSDDDSEAAARHLAYLLPKLIKRFGSNPLTSTAVLRLVRLLNLDIFQELRQNQTEYAALLHEIKAQFKSHADADVLKEASVAMLHAQGFEDLEETTEDQIGESWEDAVDDFRKRYPKSDDIAVRGDTKIDRLTTLATAVTRIRHLAEISNPVEHLEKIPTRPTAAQRTRKMATIDLLLEISGRGYLQTPDDEIDDYEDGLVMAADKAARLYFMWKSLSIKTSFSSGETISDSWIEALKARQETFANALILTISSRAGHDPCRLEATGCLLELYLLFHVVLAPLRTQIAGGPILSLLRTVEIDVQEEILSIFATAEKNFAKKAGKRLEPPADDDEPEDMDSDSEDEDGEDQSKSAAEVLRAEQQLCELTSKIVLALSAGVIPESAPGNSKMRRRILRNKSRLGHNMAKILAVLDVKTAPKKKNQAPKIKKPTGKEKSREVVVDSDEEDEGEERDEEQERLRELMADEEEPVEDEEVPEVVEEQDVEMLGD